jgi:hypothetical protein
MRGLSDVVFRKPKKWSEKIGKNINTRRDPSEHS